MAKEVKILSEAVQFVKDSSKSKFVGSVDMDIVLNLREKQKKEVVRGSVNLPNSLGDEKKVIVFADEKDAKIALEAGAIKAGIEELVNEIDKGFSEFDVVIATPSAMLKIVKVARVLGPKGLMPNPKNGTITTNIAATVKSFIAGRLNYKTAQDQGVIRLKVAKVDMDNTKIEENIIAVLQSIQNESKKLVSNPFKKIVISPTMGAGVKLDISDIMQKL